MRRRRDLIRIKALTDALDYECDKTEQNQKHVESVLQAEIDRTENFIRLSNLRNCGYKDQFDKGYLKGLQFVHGIIIPE